MRARHQRRWQLNIVVGIEDYAPLAQKMCSRVQSGNERKAKNLLLRKRVYQTPEPLARKIGISR